MNISYIRCMDVFMFEEQKGPLSVIRWETNEKLRVPPDSATGHVERIPKDSLNFCATETIFRAIGPPSGHHLTTLFHDNLLRSR